MTISASDVSVPIQHADRFFIGGQWVLPSSDSTITVIDSHTEGEPTRVIVEGGPPLGDGTLAQRRERFAREFDHFTHAQRP